MYTGNSDNLFENINPCETLTGQYVYNLALALIYHLFIALALDKH